MCARTLTFSSLAVCVMAIGVAVVQHRQLSELRTEHESAFPEDETKPIEETARLRNTSIKVSEPPAELLRLRGEVSRLRIRQRELSDVVEENTRLRAQVEQRQESATNSYLPPGYKLRSEARFVGYGSPEQTVESFLWAVQNDDEAGILRAFTPETAALYEERVNSPPDPNSFLEALASEQTGLFVGQPEEVKGVIVVQVRLLTAPWTAEVPFYLIGGEWKMGQP